MRCLEEATQPKIYCRKKDVNNDDDDDKDRNDDDNDDFYLFIY